MGTAASIVAAVGDGVITGAKNVGAAGSISLGGWLKKKTAVDTNSKTVSAAAARANPAYQVLTPQQVIALASSLGPQGVFFLNPLMGGIPVREAWRMLRLFEEQVKPYLP